MTIMKHEAEALWMRLALIRNSSRNKPSEPSGGTWFSPHWYMRGRALYMVPKMDEYMTADATLMK